jgi:PAS domain S-box-containing protein
MLVQIIGEDQMSRPPPPDSDELLRLVVESATDFAIIAMDAQGHVTAWNIGAERLLGYLESEIVGQNGDMIFTAEDRLAGIPAGEMSQALNKGRAEDERWHIRKDGSRFWGSGVLMPLTARETGFVKIMRDLTDRMAAQDRLKESEELFRLLATNIPQLVFRSRATGERTWGSPQWEIFTGLGLPQSVGFGWLDAVHPDDRDLTLEAWREAQSAGEYYVEHRIRRSTDGEYRWHQTRAKPVDGHEQAADWVGTSTDVHDMRGLQDRQTVLLAELQHRTRNLLAVVQSIARQTLRTSPSIDEFGKEFEGRLQALGRVQGLLARVEHQPIDLGELVTAELSAQGDGLNIPGKVSVEGPPVQLPPNSAQALALAIHELTTNAVKYGALKQPDGRLSVLWQIDEAHSGEWRVILDWIETGVSMSETAEPKRHGFGSELIKRAPPFQLKADTRLEFGSDGVSCQIVATIPREAAADV